MKFDAWICWLETLAPSFGFSKRAFLCLSALSGPYSKPGASAAWPGPKNTCFPCSCRALETFPFSVPGKGTEGHFWLLDMALATQVTGISEQASRLFEMRRDYYALLDIPRSATTRQIRSGYQWAGTLWARYR